MGMNAVYKGPADCPPVIPLFPLAGALLLPRGQMPLNIFEPRYLSMVDDALRSTRVIGMIQPDSESLNITDVPKVYSVGCAGRITQVAETGDGRYILSLTGISRFRLVQELPVMTLYRQARVDYEPFLDDFTPRAGEEAVDRESVIRMLKEFVEANNLQLDWRGVHDAPNEALVNALSMMCPFGVREKQVLLEAPDLRSRAEVLIAMTEIELAKAAGGSETILQ